MRLQLKSLLLIVFLFVSSHSWAQLCTSLYVHLTTGIWAEEVSWSISDQEGIEYESEIGFDDHATYVTEVCLEPGCYSFNMFDTFGDGWQGGFAEVFDNQGNLLFTAELVDGFEQNLPFEFLINCGCTDPAASNYDDEAGADNGTCFYCNDNYAQFQLTTGIWAEEISWGLLDENDVALYAGTGYFDNQFYSVDFCLPDGCFWIHAIDSYGDGWQGGSFQIVDGDGTVICAGAVPAGESEAFFGFSLNGDCEIPGCTNDIATNYQPGANVDDGSCEFVSENVTLLGQWTDLSLPQNGFGARYNEVWGDVINGREYAFIGSTLGTHIIDVHDPVLPTEVAFIEGAFSSASVVHRDYHTHNGYLYASCDQGTSTLQVIDLSPLPNAPLVIYDSEDLFSRTHNIFIDIQHDRLYAVSASGFGLSSPLLVIDISDPFIPVLEFDLTGLLTGAHDIYVEDNIAYFNGSGTGLWIIDFNGETPQIIGSLSEYPDAGGNHSGWLDSSNNVYVFADENYGFDLKVSDVSDPSDIQVLSTFNSDVDPSSIPHNLIIKENYVCLSYYHDGLQIFDIADPENPVKAGYYDTYLPDDHSGFKGAWGVYPLLPSGNILVSDMQSGLFVLEFNPSDECAADFDGDGFVNVSDLLIFLSDYGCPSGCVADLNGTDTTDAADLLLFLAAYGTNCL